MKKNGFSLMEVLLYVLFIGIVLTGFFLLVPQFLEIRLQSQFENSRRHQEIFITQRLNSLLRFAKNIEVSENKVRILSQNNDEILFFVDQGRFWIQYEDLPPQALSSNDININQGNFIFHSPLFEYDLQIKNPRNEKSKHSLRQSIFIYSPL